MALTNGDGDRGQLRDFTEEYNDADHAVAAAVAVRKDLRARIKGAGFNLKAFDRMRKLLEISEDRANAEDIALRRYMAWMDKPLGYQGRMFETAVGNGEDEDGGEGAGEADFDEHAPGAQEPGEERPPVHAEPAGNGATRSRNRGGRPRGAKDQQKRKRPGTRSRRRGSSQPSA